MAFDHVNLRRSQRMLILWKAANQEGKAVQCIGLTYSIVVILWSVTTKQNGKKDGGMERGPVHLQFTFKVQFAFKNGYP